MSDGSDAKRFKGSEQPGDLLVAMRELMNEQSREMRTWLGTTLQDFRVDQDKKIEEVTNQLATYGQDVSTLKEEVGILAGRMQTLEDQNSGRASRANHGAQLAPRQGSKVNASQGEALNLNQVIVGGFTSDSLAKELVAKTEEIIEELRMSHMVEKVICPMKRANLAIVNLSQGHQGRPKQWELANAIRDLRKTENMDEPTKTIWAGPCKNREERQRSAWVTKIQKWLVALKPDLLVKEGEIEHDFGRGIVWLKGQRIASAQGPSPSVPAGSSGSIHVQGRAWINLHKVGSILDIPPDNLKTHLLDHHW